MSTEVAVAPDYILTQLLAAFAHNGITQPDASQLALARRFVIEVPVEHPYHDRGVPKSVTGFESRVADAGGNVRNITMAELVAELKRADRSW